MNLTIDLKLNIGQFSSKSDAKIMCIAYISANFSMQRRVICWQFTARVGSAIARSWNCPKLAALCSYFAGLRRKMGNCCRSGPGMRPLNDICHFPFQDCLGLTLTCSSITVTALNTSSDVGDKSYESVHHPILNEGFTSNCVFAIFPLCCAY